ncbi:MAG: NADAR family protein [Minisyncoccia bacterium]
MTHLFAPKPDDTPSFSGLESWLNNPKGEARIHFYEDEHYYLSNFSAFALVIGGEIWMTVEHAYQGMKFPNHPKIRAEIEDALSAHEAKKIARVNKEFVRPDWNEVKLGIMEALIRAKIDQHPYVLKKLLQTGTAVLIENSAKDAFWGRGPDWQGYNHLGRIWMKLRAEQLILFPQEKQGGC